MTVSARREVTRQRLLDAAVVLIADQGFTATTVDQIAERAGVAKGTVYYNFRSKAALFSALLEYGIERLASRLREAAGLVVSGADPEGAYGTPDPLEALEAVVAAELAFIGEHEAFARLLIAETWRAGGDWQHAARLIRERAVGVISEVLRSAVTRGDLRADLDTEMAASAVFGMVLTVALDWRALQPARPLAEIQATLMDLLRGRLTT
ncbi:TetR/AcrR family transcriptional regulator [Actinomadura scrupuli]|uniref:TetR/AcrR family transcriptional regulator n=1 Tax=Actinomadura scrupuli TaxID=559629 RepID=UPI003D95289F